MKNILIVVVLFFMLAVEAKEIKPIESDFTQKYTIGEQRTAHLAAKNYLEEQLPKVGAVVMFVSPSIKKIPPNVKDVVIDQTLNSNVFFWELTSGVQLDIQADGKNNQAVVLYGVASQFNAAEASSRFTPKPGTAVMTYVTDHTQGPTAQLQFADEQVEIINNAANLGYNGLVEVLDDQTKDSVKHGYLTPETTQAADQIIFQLQHFGNKIEYPSIGNIPKGDGNTERVYEILVAAPAFGMYFIGTATSDQKAEIEFLCSYYSYAAQFKQAIDLSKLRNKPVILKATAPGLGVFGNRVENVAKGFYLAAREMEADLLKHHIQVRLQVFHKGGETSQMAKLLGLNPIQQP